MATMDWLTNPTDTVLYHQIFLATQEAFTENGDEALDSSVIFGTLLVGPCIPRPRLNSGLT